jgi:hypothetical protein
VDDLDLQWAVLLRADFLEVDIGDVGNLVRGNVLGGFVNLVRDAFRGGSTIGKVVLDTEILVGACSS